MANAWSGKRVLIVDDDAVDVLELTQEFQALGFIVCGTATTAPEALQNAGKLRPDLITMDINLGSPGEGIAAVTLLRMTDLETPVLFITRHVEPNADQIRSLGRAELVCKPCLQRELMDGLHRLERDAADAHKV